jgi:ubiquinone biosynthesis protein
VPPARTTTLLRHGIPAILLAAAGRREAAARSVRAACEALGPVFIKLGQLVSVRPDLFPPELVMELSGLRDGVPAADPAAVREVFLREFGAPPERLFASFDPEPTASASIAQVHRATLAAPARPVWGPVLPSGASVAVKIVRPNAAGTVRADLAEARRIVSLARRIGLFPRVDLGGAMAQLAATLESELDLRAEGRAADRFAFNFRDDPGILIPRVIWGRSSRRVLTMEWIDGWPLSSLADAATAGVDGEAVARRGAEAFMRQVLVDGLFHADLHHANLFVTPDGRIAYLDFGIVGMLSPGERSAAARLLAALVDRDARRALDASTPFGVSLKAGHEEAMLRDLDALLLKTMRPGTGDVRHFGLGFMRLLSRHGAAIPVGYALLVKALVTVEGVARELSPKSDLIGLAAPFVTRLLAPSLLSPAALLPALGRSAGAAARALVAQPGKGSID